jgi:hypothetical protein
MGPQRFKRQFIVAILLAASIIWLMRSFEHEDADVARTMPLLQKYIHPPSGKGGGKTQTH